MKEIKGKLALWADMPRYDESRRLVPIVVKDDEAFTVFWATERMFSNDSSLAVLQDMAKRSLIAFKSGDNCAKIR